MIGFTKEEALLAAEQFCYGIELWTRQFTENRDLAERLDSENISEDGLHKYNIETKERLQNSVFYEVIDILYDFATNGKWKGENEFNHEAMENVSDEVHFYLTELCRFDEVFAKAKDANARLVFMGLSNTNCYLDILINEKHILEILTTFTRAVLARWQITNPFSSEFRIEELSILSGLNIKTVRNAVSSKGADRLVVNNNGDINHQEAIRWLKRKKGFSGPFHLNEEIQYSSYESIGQLTYHCDSLFKKENVSLNDVASQLDLSAKEKFALKALMKSREDEVLELITPNILKRIGEELKASELEIFVIEGSKVISTLVAQIKANKLFSI